MTGNLRLMHVILLPVLCLTLIVPLSACGSSGGISSVTAEPAWPASATFDLAAIPGLVPATVTDVVDGDTVNVTIDGQPYAVRYIGVNAPETHHPIKGLEPYGPEATEHNRQLVEGQTVYLEADVSDTDRYGRLLRYVYLPSGLMVNAALVWEGFAHSITYPPDVEHQDLLLELQRDAQAGNHGLWGIATPAPAPVEEPGTVTDQGYTCDRCIKGNIRHNTGEKIYHIPGCPDYDASKINESSGERWFSTEAEAQAAGWRKALNCP